MTDTALSAAVTWRRRDDVIWRTTSRGLLVLAMEDRAAPFEVVGPAKAIWDVLAKPVTEEELASSLADRFHIGAEEILPAVRPLLDDLVVRQVLEQGRPR